jgi:hypothetical protein
MQNCGVLEQHTEETEAGTPKMRFSVNPDLNDPVWRPFAWIFKSPSGTTLTYRHTEAHCWGDTRCHWLCVFCTHMRKHQKIVDDTPPKDQSPRDYRHLLPAWQICNNWPKEMTCERPPLKTVWREADQGAPLVTCLSQEGNRIVWLREEIAEYLLAHHPPSKDLPTMGGGNPTTPQHGALSVPVPTSKTKTKFKPTILKRGDTFYLPN